MTANRTRTALVFLAAASVGLLSACTPPEGQAVSCGSFAQEPDVEALVSESESIVVGDFKETGESTAEVTVEKSLKGNLAAPDTIEIEWDSGCGSPLDAVTSDATAESRYLYFLVRENGQFRLAEGSYGMFDADSALIGQVSSAIDETG